MKMVKIMIFVNPSDPSKGRKWVEVEGRDITFAGFTEYKFILHRTIKSLYAWHVAESTTGMYFAEGNTPNEALHMAKGKLTEIGKERFIVGLERAAKTFSEVKLIEEKTNA